MQASSFPHRDGSEGAIALCLSACLTKANKNSLHRIIGEEDKNGSATGRPGKPQRSSGSSG